MKSKLLKMVMLMMLLTMVFSTNVLAAEGEDEVSLLSETSGYCEYEETETVTLSWTGLNGFSYEAVINVDFSLGYTYSEGSWVYTSYYGTDVTEANINGIPVVVAKNNNGGSNSLGGEDYYEIGDYAVIKVGIRVDEYGEVTTYVQVIEKLR